MRRSLILASSLLTLTLVLTACGDTDSDTSSPDGMSDSPMDGGMDGGSDSMGGGMDGMGHDSSSPVADGARRVEVDATSFEFDPEDITVTAGEDIAVVLTAEDILHDFTIDELDAHVAADKGETAEGGLRADEPGRYTYYCSVAGHREAGMEGTLIVEAP
jgi:cytochrome c oxidase subunit 2